MNTAVFVTGDLDDCEMVATTRARHIHLGMPGSGRPVFAEGVVRVLTEVATRHPVYQIHLLEYDSVGFPVVNWGELGEHP